MAGLGHNRGPELDAEFGWRRHAWGRARAALLPTLPIEVVRLRVARAAELGLPYRTYAGVRAASGRDVIGFLFSSNALQLLRATDRLPPARAERLASLIRADRVAVLQPPISPAQVMPPCDAAAEAPPFTASWPAMRDRLAALIAARGGRADGFLVIGETPLEREWAEAGKTAGFLSGEAYFAA